MNRVTEAIREIKSGIEKLSTVANITLVTGTATDLKIVVQSERDLEQVPGATAYLPCTSDTYVAEAQRVHEETTFLCLVRLLDERKTA